MAEQSSSSRARLGWILAIPVAVAIATGVGAADSVAGDSYAIYRLRLRVEFESHCRLELRGTVMRAVATQRLLSPLTDGVAGHFDTPTPDSLCIELEATARLSGESRPGSPYASANRVFTFDVYIQDPGGAIVLLAPEWGTTPAVGRLSTPSPRVEVYNFNQPCPEFVREYTFDSLRSTLIPLRDVLAAGPLEVSQVTLLERDAIEVLLDPCRFPPVALLDSRGLPLLHPSDPLLLNAVMSTSGATSSRLRSALSTLTSEQIGLFTDAVARVVASHVDATAQNLTEDQSPVQHALASIKSPRDQQAVSALVLPRLVQVQRAYRLLCDDDFYLRNRETLRLAILESIRAEGYAEENADAWAEEYVEVLMPTADQTLAERLNAFEGSTTQVERDVVMRGVLRAALAEVELDPDAASRSRNYISASEVSAFTVLILTATLVAILVNRLLSRP